MRGRKNPIREKSLCGFKLIPDYLDGEEEDISYGGDIVQKILAIIQMGDCNFSL